MNVHKITQLKNDIEKIDKIHHIKIFKILKENNIKFSENRNGIFINMNSFNDVTIKTIENTLLYIKEQEKNLKDVESIKNELKVDFFKKTLP
jgi:hypothetical protein